MNEPPEEREFGPSISRNKRRIIGFAMIVVLVGLVLLAALSGSPRI